MQSIELLPQKKSKSETMLQCVLTELVETEENYVQDLILVDRVFIVPLRERKILNEQQLATIFGNWPVLVGVNEKLLEGLRGAKIGAVAQVFIQLAPYMKAYAQFCARQPKGLDLCIRLMEEHAAFAAFREYCMQLSECRGLDLNSFLLRPVSRLAKYPLLLREARKHAPRDAHASLDKAIAQIEAVMHILNETARAATFSLVDAFERIECPPECEIVTPTRRLMGEGDLKLIAIATHGVARKAASLVHYYFFNDLLLLCKRRKSKDIMFAYISFDDANVRPSMSNANALEIMLINDMKMWTLKCKKGEAARDALVMQWLKQIEAHLELRLRNGGLSTEEDENDDDDDDNNDDKDKRNAQKSSSASGASKRPTKKATGINTMHARQDRLRKKVSTLKTKAAAQKFQVACDKIALMDQSSQRSQNFTVQARWHDQSISIELKQKEFEIGNIRKRVHAEFKLQTPVSFISIKSNHRPLFNDGDLFRNIDEQNCLKVEVFE